eukprot:CAMPEP_0119326048 /NCGR_PEP_ID=MMETSP1333-20130426/67323_1 /TAXON_ID=418940 /ORGANISM="Scyphosphaera apsteinii, Strain RCC1455" /LENGTH=258 /DNA_ID=CAMNT_0007334229 /DNA_START=117 /DNA_END=893 /DNA_ORIENTATION=-
MSATAGIVNEEISIGGQRQLTQRFVEADVGMTFQKTLLNERLFSRPWPDEWPFPAAAFRRQDESDDADFYAVPRLVYHIDEGAVRALTNYYKYSIPPASTVLDICSSWVSHYPSDFPTTMRRIAGTGMNALELQANNQLSDFTPHNLNIDPKLPYDDAQFDVVTCVVSVDYLNQPLKIFSEVRRVLKPGGKFILSQSNRCFPSKAIAMWLGMDDLQHCLVIAAYFHYCGGWEPANAFDVSPRGPNTRDPLFIVESTKL